MKKKNDLLYDEVDAPAVIVPSYSLETYRAVSKEQAEKEHIIRCIKPKLPDNHRVYSKMHYLPDSPYERKDLYDGKTIWKILKDKITYSYFTVSGCEV